MRTAFKISCACVVAGWTLFAPKSVAQSADTTVTTEPVEISEPRLGQSATARSAYDVGDDVGIGVDAADLSSRAANFFVGSNGARSFTNTFALRGLTNTPIFGDPAVTVYLDDLPLASGFTFPSGLVGFTGAELFRGPEQNTRFGRAGTVGVLRFTTPTTGSADDDDVRAYYGNYDARGVIIRGDARPSADTDVYSAAGYEARDGYIYNDVLHQRIDGQESESALTRMRWDEGKDGNWTLLLTGQRVRDGVQALVPLSGPKFEVSRSEEGVTHEENFGASFRGAFDTSVGALSETTSFSYWALGPATNALNFGFALLEDGSDLRQNSWSEEINLITLRHDAWQASVGLFATTDRTTGAFVRAFSGNVFEDSTYQINHHALATYGEVDYRVGPDLTLIAGARLEENWKKMDRREIVPGSDVFDLSTDSGALLPKISANYQVDRNTEASLGLGTGYKPGGFSSFTGNPALARFDPERLVGLDAAITSARKGVWSATLRGYAYSVHGYQIERSFQTGAQSDDYFVINAPRARSIGAEAEFSASVSRELSVGVDVGWNDITLREFTDPYTHVNYTGKRAPYAPLFTGTVFAEYHAAQGWFARAETVGTGRTFYTESESPMFSQSSVILLNARLGYEHARYRVSVYGENLTDREYFSAITPGTLHGTPGAPRTYGLEVDARF